MNKLLKKIRNNQGETLIEVVVSCAIFAIIAVSLLSVILGAADIGRDATGVSKADSVAVDRLKTGSGITTVSADSTAANNINGQFKDASGSVAFSVQSGGTYKKAIAGEAKLPLSLFEHGTTSTDKIIVS